MAKRLRSTIIAISLIVAGLAALYPLTLLNERVKPPVNPDWIDEDLAVSSARTKGFVFGAEGLVADWHWMQALQYVGEKLINANDNGIQYSIDDLTPLNPRLLYPQLDAATTYDPKFTTAYAYGAVVLPAIDPQLAIRLAEKGIAENPGEWRLLQHLGFIYWRMGNYEKAADAYQRGAEIPGAPPFFKLMAAQMKADGGGRETARAQYRQMKESAEDGQTRDIAALKLLELDYLDERDAVAKVLTDFTTRTGRCVGSFSELVPLLRNVRLPNQQEFHLDRSGSLVDPSGVPYLLDTAKCTIRIDLKNSKIPDLTPIK